jgi:hypothetical protein
VQVEILTYAPTEFYHCHHCEVVWDSVGFGRRIRANQHDAGLPPELQAEYAAISEWGGGGAPAICPTVAGQGGRRGICRRRDQGRPPWLRRFPACIIDGRERIVGFDREQLDAALERRR